HIPTIQQIEGISSDFESRSLSRKVYRAGKTDVPCLEAVPLVRIAREIPNAIGDVDEVMVRIKAHKQCKRPRTLKNDDVAQGQVAQESVLRTYQCDISHEALPGVLVRQRCVLPPS